MFFAAGRRRGVLERWGKFHDEFVALITNSIPRRQADGLLAVELGRSGGAAIRSFAMRPTWGIKISPIA